MVTPIRRRINRHRPTDRPSDAIAGREGPELVSGLRMPRYPKRLFSRGVILPANGPDAAMRCRTGLHCQVGSCQLLFRRHRIGADGLVVAKLLNSGPDE